jgi:putative spermidine/putrescine transport system permease protein
MTRYLASPAAATRTAGWLVVCYLLVPVALVVPISLTDQPYLSFPSGEISWRHYAKLFQSQEWLSSFLQSAGIALTTAVVCTVLGTLCAIGCWRIGGALRTAVLMMMLLPLVTPQIVFLLGFYRLLVDLKAIGGAPGVIVAHVVTGIPFVIVIVSAGLSDLDLRLYQAARGLGATSLQAVHRVILPNIRWAVLSGFVFAFMHSWDDIVMVLFIAGRDLVTIPRRIWDGIHDDPDPVLAAISSLIILVTLLLLLVYGRFQERRR